MNKCPVCKQDIDKQEYFMLGLEKPYINIFFHKECYKTIIDITSFLNENLEEILRDFRSIKNKK